MEQREDFTQRWKEVQAKFVDKPAESIVDASLLVTEVMQARGYPVSDFEQQAADISVDHPEVVSNYRAANEITAKNKKLEADTEELRQAMVHYRALFKELLEPEQVKVKEMHKELSR